MEDQSSNQLSQPEQIDTKTGYKKTKLGWIPVDWQIVKQKDLLELLTDYEANGSFADVKANVTVFDSANFAWYVRATDLENDSSLDEVRYVDQHSYMFLRKTPLFGEELLITKRGEIGKLYFFKQRTDHATVAPNLYLLKLNKKVLPLYLFYYYKSYVGNNSLKRINASSTLGALYKNDVKNLIIPLPPLPEQRKIAEILSTWDEAIDKLTALIKKKKELKKGLMQQLLTGKKRFPEFVKSAEMKETKLGWIPEDWEYIKLDEIGEFIRGKGIAKNEIVGEGIPCIRYGELYTTHHFIIKKITSYINTKSAENSTKIEGGDILFAGSGETPEEIGKCAAYIQDDEAYAGGDILVMRPKKQNSTFLGYLLNHVIVNKQKSRISQGHSVVHLYPSGLKEIAIPLPPPPEQTKIAETLNINDIGIDALNLKLDKFIEQKKGLMQQLLIGKTRVNVN